MSGLRRSLVAIGFLILGPHDTAWAQGSLPSPRMILVNGQPMRVRTGGLERRRPGSPVVILESGLGSTIEQWNSVFDAVSHLAPVVAYDRRGIGQSPFDDVPPTIARVTETLHELLRVADIKAPYVLATQSWGVAFVRMFIDRYPTEVVGAVFLDVTDFERTPEEEVAELPSGVQVLDNAPSLPNGPPGFRAEVQELRAEGVRKFATLRATRLPAALPIAVVVGGAVPRDFSPAAAIQMRAFKRLQLKHQAAWAFISTHGLVLMSSSAGHNVVIDEPALALQAIRHVLDSAPSISP